MATSWAYKAAATPAEICRVATWASVSTFVKHYRLDVQASEDAKFGRKVLEATIPLSLTQPFPLFWVLLCIAAIKLLVSTAFFMAISVLSWIVILRNKLQYKTGEAEFTDSLLLRHMVLMPWWSNMEVGAPLLKEDILQLATKEDLRALVVEVRASVQEAMVDIQSDYGHLSQPLSTLERGLDAVASHCARLGACCADQMRPPITLWKKMYNYKKKEKESLVRRPSCLKGKVNYPDQVFMDSATLFQGIHMKKPPDRILVKYGSDQGLSVPDFKDERAQRWAYELAFNTLKYQDLLEIILLDSGFYYSQPLPDEMTSLVMVMLYDFQDRKFLPRCLSNKEVIIEEVQEVEHILYSFKTKLAASLARSRIEHDLRSIQYILPENVRKQEQRASTLPLYAWINTAKTSLTEVFNTLKKEGFTKVDSPSDLDGYKYCLDRHCDDVLVFSPHLKEELTNLDIFIDYKLVLQDKSYNLAVHSMKHLMDTEGDILVAKPCSGFTVAHLSVLTSQSACSIFVCGIQSEAREDELQELFAHMECKNVKLLKERFTDIDPHDPRLQKARVILLLPQCSGSGVCDPVEFVLYEYGDIALLQDFSKGTVAADKVSDLAKQQLSELNHAMKFNKVQSIVYCTCSVYHEENEDVINRALEFKRENNERLVYRLVTPVLLDDSSEIKSASDKFVKVEPAETTNGYFLAVMKREAEALAVTQAVYKASRASSKLKQQWRPKQSSTKSKTAQPSSKNPTETVSAKDVLARAAATGLLDGIGKEKALKKVEKRKKGKSAKKTSTNTPHSYMKINEFLDSENNLTNARASPASQPGSARSPKDFHQKGSIQYRKPTKQAVSKVPTTVKDTNPKFLSIAKEAGMSKTKAEEKMAILKPVQIQLPPVMMPFYCNPPAARARNPVQHQRWSSGVRISTCRSSPSCGYPSNRMGPKAWFNSRQREDPTHPSCQSGNQNRFVRFDIRDKQLSPYRKP
ncbi:putative methyltransferase NSUN7 [Rhinophrynus dorsalis]